jgi:4-hydroxyphenylpyruvate dioxygenase
MSQVAERIATERDFLPLIGTDHIEFYVGNAKQAAQYYRSAFGMKLVAYSGPETGARGRASYAVEQEKIRFVLTAGLQPDDPITEHVRLHGDGVHSIALEVDDAESAYRETVRRGARPVLEPTVSRDHSGEVRISGITVYGDTIHTFVERGKYKGAFLPGFAPVEGADTVSRPVGLKYIDHIVANVALG